MFSVIYHKVIKNTIYELKKINIHLDTPRLYTKTHLLFLRSFRLWLQEERDPFQVSSSRSSSLIQDDGW